MSKSRTSVTLELTAKEARALKTIVGKAVAWSNKHVGDEAMVIFEALAGARVNGIAGIEIGKFAEFATYEEEAA